MKAGSYSSGRVSNPLLSYLLFRKNTKLTVNKSLKWAGYWRRITPDTWGHYCNAAITSRALSLQHSRCGAPALHPWQDPVLSHAELLQLQWCQRALPGDWARTRLDAFCWSQLLWCNKIKVNPRHSLADSLYKPKLICKLVSQSEDEMYRRIFFCFLNLSLFLTDKLLSVK